MSVKILFGALPATRLLRRQHPEYPVKSRESLKKNGGIPPEAMIVGIGGQNETTNRVALARGFHPPASRGIKHAQPAEPRSCNAK